MRALCLNKERSDELPVFPQAAPESFDRFGPSLPACFHTAIPSSIAGISRRAEIICGQGN
jgi:hypothetical protein